MDPRKIESVRLTMDFKDRLIEHYVFTENNGSEIVSRYRHEILPA
jgi:hypothetical protein